jgi:hypothetical protein
MNKRTIASSPPETQSQAEEWERTKSRYVNDGLCHKCAAQAAWAHQTRSGGWSAINPPCPNCLVVVAQLPLATTNSAWRKTARHQEPRRGVTPRSTGHQGANNTHASAWFSAASTNGGGQ